MVVCELVLVLGNDWAGVGLKPGFWRGGRLWRDSCILLHAGMSPKRGVCASVAYSVCTYIYVSDVSTYIHIYHPAGERGGCSCVDHGLFAIMILYFLGVYLYIFRFSAWHSVVGSIGLAHDCHVFRSLA